MLREAQAGAERRKAVLEDGQAKRARDAEARCKAIMSAAPSL
jgi:hypothetical protein